MCYHETCYQYETIDRCDRTAADDAVDRANEAPSPTKYSPTAEPFPRMRRRALLSTAAAVWTAPLAGCPVPPWGEIPETVDGAEVTLRREHTGEFESEEPSPHDDAVLIRAVDADPPRLTVRGRLLDGSRDCYRVDLIEATLDDDRLLLRLTDEDDPDWDGGPCPDIAQPHPYEVEITFPEAPMPERVEVRHGDETVLDEEV